MAYFEIKRITSGEKAWSWDYKDGLKLQIKPEPYKKLELVDILKRLKNDPVYTIEKNEEQLAIFYVDESKGQQLAWWKMQDNPIEKLLKELEAADIKYKNPEDDPSNTDKNMQNNIGTGETGS